MCCSFRQFSILSLNRAVIGAIIQLQRHSVQLSCKTHTPDQHTLNHLSDGSFYLPSRRPLQEHRRSCQYEQLQCCNPGCRVALQRRYLQEHLTNTCPHRMEPCPHCRHPQRLSLLQVKSCPGGSQSVAVVQNSPETRDVPVMCRCSRLRTGCLLGARNKFGF